MTRHRPLSHVLLCTIDIPIHHEHDLITNNSTSLIIHTQVLLVFHGTTVCKAHLPMGVDRGAAPDVSDLEHGPPTRWSVQRQIMR